MNRRAQTVWALLIVFLALVSPLRAAPFLLTTPTYSQDFNSLANTGTTNTTLPPGWMLLETGTSTLVNQAYAASNGTGSSNFAGDTYSFGATGSTERAFGGVLSGSLTPTIGFAFTNGLNGPITQLSISYTGEQWRLGTAGRGPDRIDFQYSLNATALDNGTWFDVNSLDFSSPVTGPTSFVGLDGNDPANQAQLSGIISGLNVPVGGTVFFRFTDFNASGNDDGLGVDNFAFTATFTAPAAVSTPLPGSAVIWLIGAVSAGAFGLRRRFWPAAN